MHKSFLWANFDEKFIMFETKLDGIAKSEANNEPIWNQKGIKGSNQIDLEG